MSFSVNIGPVVATFLDEKNNYCIIRKASNYLGNKPQEWQDDDYYLIIPLASRVAVKFMGGNNTISVNEQFPGIENTFISLASNRIVVKEGNKIYTLVLHLVAEDDHCCIAEEDSSGIRFEDKMKIHLFEPLSPLQSFLKIFWRKPIYDSKKESWASFQVEGVDLINDG